VATIVSIDRAWFVARIFEHMLAKVRVGAVAEVELNAFPDHPFLGTVEHLSATVDAEAQTVVARIPIENREDLLRIGLFGSARIATTDPSADQRRCSPSPRLRDRHRRQAGGVRARRGRVLRAARGRARRGRGRCRRDPLKACSEGELVVTRGAWTLKSVLLKGTFGEDHGH
jgi:cobalt-zinc-cadmium efflux system membrane fusion protein